MRLRLTIACGLAAVMLAGCQTTNAPPPAMTSTPHTLDAKSIAMVQDGVRRTLKDPESARFGAMIASRQSNGDIYVCGYVNAKNSFGGYVGEQPFNGVLLSVLPVFRPYGFGSSEAERYVVRSACRDHGLSI